MATALPNFVAGMTVPITMLLQLARKQMGIGNAALAVGLLCLVIALFSLSCLQETFHKDLDCFDESI